MRVVIVVLLVCCCLTAKAQTTNYHVYALYVVNIAKYSSWPNMNEELQIAVFGKSKVYEELQKQNGKMVNGHALKVQLVEDFNQIGNAHIVYVSDGKSGSIEDVVKATEGRSIMIVAEREGLFKKGAGFSFIILENNTLKFDMNSSELEKRQIKVSKSLTTLAHSSL